MEQPDLPTVRDKNNRRLTNALFYEHTQNPEFAWFTCNTADKTVNGKLYRSMRKCYVECMDPTDTVFIDKYFQGDFEHFGMLVQNSKLDVDIEAWREEVALRLQSLAIQKLMASAPSNQKDALQAAKYLGSRAWEKQKTKRGRPSNKPVPQDPVASDYERLKLVSSQGTKSP